MTASEVVVVFGGRLTGVLLVKTMIRLGGTVVVVDIVDIVVGMVVTTGGTRVGRSVGFGGVVMGLGTMGVRMGVRMVVTGGLGGGAAMFASR